MIYKWIWWIKQKELLSWSLLADDWICRKVIGFRKGKLMVVPPFPIGIKQKRCRADWTVSRNRRWTLRFCWSRVIFCLSRVIFCLSRAFFRLSRVIHILTGSPTPLHQQVGPGTWLGNIDLPIGNIQHGHNNVWLPNTWCSTPSTREGANKRGESKARNIATGLAAAFVKPLKTNSGKGEDDRNESTFQIHSYQHYLLVVRVHTRTWARLTICQKLLKI